MFKKIGMIMSMLLLTAGYSYSQEVKFSGSLTGFGSVKTAYSKRIALFNYYDCTYEKQFMDSWGWRIGLGVAHVQYEGMTNSSVGFFREKVFLTLPVLVRKYYSLSRQSFTYVESGIINKYELTDKIDYDSNMKADEKFKSGGYAADFSVSAGFKTGFGKGYTMDLGFGGQQNIFTSYKKKENKVSTSAALLTLAFSKNLQRFKKLKK